MLADDHPIFRDGLRRLLEAEPDMKVVGEARDGVEVLERAPGVKPDVLLLDLAMPRQSGLEALPGLAEQLPKTRIILLTAAVETRQIVEALHIGARGVVLKEAATRLLISSIHEVMAGHYWVGNQVVPNLMNYLTSLIKESGKNTYGLTPREIEITSAVVAAFSNREIAEYFKISEDTVKHHMSNIFDKLGVSTRLELALFAVNHGIPLKRVA
jgi:two-component system, NarL family, nitrate/nitrite response regulator NarL